MEKNQEKAQKQTVQSQYIQETQPATAVFGNTQQKIYYDQPKYYTGQSYVQNVPYVDNFYRSQVIGNTAQSQLNKSWVEYYPYERSYIEYVPQTKVEYVPVEKKFEDYVEVQHEIEQVPVTKLEKYVDYVPVDRYYEKTEYVPQERSFVKNQSALSGYRSFQYPVTATTATAQPVVTTTTTNPVIATTTASNVYPANFAPTYSYVNSGYYPGAYTGLRTSAYRYAQPNYATTPYSSYVGYGRYPSYYDRPYYSSYRPGYYGSYYGGYNHPTYKYY